MVLHSLLGDDSNKLSDSPDGPVHLLSARDQPARDHVATHVPRGGAVHRAAIVHSGSDFDVPGDRAVATERNNRAITNWPGIAVFREDGRRSVQLFRQLKRIYGTVEPEASCWRCASQKRRKVHFADVRLRVTSCRARH